MSTMNTVGRPTTPNAVQSKPATLTGARGLLQNEPLIFEGDGWGKTGVDLPEPQGHGSDLGDLVRKDPIGLPGLSEPEAMRPTWAIWCGATRSACRACPSPRPCATMCG